MSSTLSGDWATSNLDAGPYWAMNSVWNKGNLVNGTDFTQSVTSDDPNNPNMNTTISWNWPNTPAQYNVYSMPGVFYGNYSGFTAPAHGVTAEKIDDIKTLTLSHDLTMTGNGDQYDTLYDMYLTSSPNGGTATHEIEIDLHTPGYMQDWIKNLPQQHFTDASGMQWTIAENNSAGPPMVLFVPSDFHDLSNATIDFKELLKAAEANGVLSGNEYFTGFGLGNEPQQGSGSMTIHSLHVNYDGDPNFTGATGGTQADDPPASGTTTAGDPPAASDPAHAGDPASGTTTPPATDPTQVSTGGTSAGNGGGTMASDGGGTMPGNGGGDTTTGHGGTATTGDGGGTTTASDAGGTTTTTDGGGTQAADGGGTTTATDGGTQTTDNGGGTQTASNGGGATTTDNGGGTAADGGMGHSAGCGGGDNHHSHHDNSAGGGNMHNMLHDIVALLHAMQQNNTTAVNNAMTALGNDVHTAMDTGSSSGFGHHHFESFTHQHFEHMWG